MPARLADPASTATAWIEAIADGRDDEAADLTSPRSLDAIGGREGFVESEIELAEAWGAWASAENLDVEAFELDDAISVVVLHGDVAHEGPPEESWAALPIVATADGDRVEPFLDLGHIEAHPDPGTVIGSDTRFNAYVLGGRDVRFLVDLRQAAEPALQSADGDQQLGELDVAGMAPGLHALTVVLWNDDGVAAQTFTYTVTG